MTLPSYPKVYNLGHRAIQDLFEGDVIVQEKVDGSQFSFGVVNGELICRSRNTVLDSIETAGKLFVGAMTTARAAFNRGDLEEGAVYRGEAMMGPRHNTLAYERAPLGNLVLFDVDVPGGIEDRVHLRGVLTDIASDLLCDVVPELYRGPVTNLEDLKALTTLPSFLGGAMEGVVIKNYDRFGVDGKMLMGKYVTPAFKEQHGNNPDWKPATNTDVLSQIQARYNHPRRWEKATERARDAGTLLESPQDIGPLIHAVQADVEAECQDEIGAQLYAYFRKQILRGTTIGLPEWYKDRLATQQFAAVEGE